MREKNKIKPRDLADYIKICIKCGKHSNKEEKMNIIKCLIEKQVKKSQEEKEHMK